MKKLNNKGFTLIELLAVIVILAVVMGVAANSVLNAMNNSRKSSLLNSAQSAADAFRTAYAEYSMSPSSGILGAADSDVSTLLAGTNAVPISAFKTGLNITVGSNNENYLDSSVVKFDKEKSSFVVCLVANPKGSYYVAAADITNNSRNPKPTMSAGTNPASGMWACSNNNTSW